MQLLKNLLGQLREVQTGSGGFHSFGRGFLLACALMCFGAAEASEAVQPGFISSLSYRGGYVTFKVVGDDGTNYCSACPGDPGGFGMQRCWVPETTKTEVAMVLMASSQGKKVSGRVAAFATDCAVYQLSIQD